MSCGGRVYKGDTILVSIPFDVSGYTDLVVSYFTIGDVKIVRTESELYVEDGYITVQFSGNDLDILPDGVLRYTVEYAVDNTDYVDSSNTMLYLKTPASYSAVTEEVIYEEGFESGYTKGVGECEEIAEEAYADGYQSGTTDGYSSGYSVGFVAGVSDTRGRMATTAITANGVYERGDGFNRVEVDVPLDTPCNIDEGKIVDMGDYFPYYSTTVVPSSGYAGLESVTVNAGSVYSQGVNDVANQFVTLSATTNGLYLPQSTYAVFKEVYVNVDTDCSSAITEAYQSGMTAGAAEQKSKLGRTVQTSNGTFTTAGDGWSAVTVNVPSKKPKVQGHISAETQIHVYDIIANQYSVGYENFITHVDGEPIGTGLSEVIPAGYHQIEVFAMNDTDWIGVQVQGNNYWLSVISLTY